jgi:hypothetical protein
VNVRCRIVLPIVAVLALASCTPEQIIRWRWEGTGQADRAVAIATRESGLRCDADNPRSSAAGLFQTMSIHEARATRLDLRWSDVTGPDCLADVLLAFSLWQEQGWRPWRT